MICGIAGSERRVLVGVDGCRGGWIALVECGRPLTARVFEDWHSLMASLPRDAFVGVDIPIGLPATGSRRCDVEARRQLGRPRGSSVFPAPVRGVVKPGKEYHELSAEHERIDGRRLARQTYGLIPKILQVDDYLRRDSGRRSCVMEIHPEMSFAVWNQGQPMHFRKSTSAGRTERERLIDRAWPELRERLWDGVRDADCKRDDLNDAFAVLWTVRRIVAGTARTLPPAPEYDGVGLRMEITV